MPSARGERGAAAESYAADALRKDGYRILLRNHRTPAGELDLVALRRGVFAFVEVKARRSRRHGPAMESVDERKQRRLRRGAAAWLAAKPEAARSIRRIRFDVISCLLAAPGSHDPPQDDRGERVFVSTAPDGTRWWIEHCEGAF